MRPLIRLDALLLAALPVAWLVANHYPPWLSAWQDGLALALLLMAALFITRPASLPRPWLLWCVLALGSLAAQGLLGIVRYTGDLWIVALYLVAFALSLAAGSTLPEGGRHLPAPRLEAFCAGLLLAAIASVGIGLLQWTGTSRLGIFGADLPPGARPFGNLAQPNHWCTASFMGLGALLVLYEGRRIGGAALGAGGLLLLGAMVASGSRTSWLQITVLVLLVIGLRRRLPLRLGWAPLALGLAFFVAGWFLWPLLNEFVQSPSTSRSVAEQVQGGVRWPLWQAMLGAITERPWLGYGWQQMVLAQHAVALDGPLLQRHFEHAHNLVIDLLVWTGLPVGAALVGLAGWAGWTLLRRADDPRVLGLLVAVGGMLAHAMVEFPAEYAYFLLPAGVMLGAAHRLSGDTGFAWPRVGVRATGAIALVALGITAFDYLRAEQGYRLLRLESAGIGTRGIETPPPDLQVLTQLEAFQRFAHQEPRAGLTPEQLALSRQVAQRFAYPSSQFRHALAAGLNGLPQEAAESLQRVCRMHPPPRCQEAIDGWREQQARHPVLGAVPPPTMPGR